MAGAGRDCGDFVIFRPSAGAAKLSLEIFSGGTPGARPRAAPPARKPQLRQAPWPTALRTLLPRPGEEAGAGVTDSRKRPPCIPAQGNRT